MGYLAQKYATLLKGPYASYWVERRRAKRTVRVMNLMYGRIFKEIPDKIKKHEVTRSLRFIKKVVHQGKVVQEAEYKFAFRIDMQEENIIGGLAKIERDFEKLRNEIKASHPDLHNRLTAELVRLYNLFRKHTINAMGKIEQYDRGAYKKILQIIDIEEKHKKDNKTFMQEVRLAMADIDVSTLRYWAIRHEIAQVKNQIKIEDKEARQIRDLITRLQKVNYKELMAPIDEKIVNKKKKGKEEVIKNVEEVIKKLEELILKLEKHVIRAFYNGYRALKRDFALIFLLLYYFEVLIQQMEEGEAKKYLPRFPVTKDIKSIEDLELEMAKHMRIIAQAGRRIYHKTKAVEHDIEQMKL